MAKTDDAILTLAAFRASISRKASHITASQRRLREDRALAREWARADTKAGRSLTLAEVKRKA